MMNLVKIKDKYSENELNALEKIFKSSHNRGKIMSASEFKKHQERLQLKKLKHFD